MLIVLYLRDKCPISPYSVKTFESSQVLGIKNFITCVIMSELRLEKHNSCGDLGSFVVRVIMVKVNSAYEPRQDHLAGSYLLFL